MDEIRNFTALVMFNSSILNDLKVYWVPRSPKATSETYIRSVLERKLD